MVHFVFGLFIILFVNQINAKTLNYEVPKISNVVVIGAGTSGLASAKYLTAQGYNVTVYEQNEELGGIWWYTDKTGKNQYGIDVHTAMYQKLRYQIEQFKYFYNNYTTRFHN